MKPKLSTISKEEFEALPQAEQIVIVCRDVIAALDLEAIVAENGTYAQWYDELLVGDVEPPFDVCDILDLSDPATGGVCHVCAKGAAVLAVARITRNRGISFVAVADDRETAREALASVFGQSLTDEMEAVFENYLGDDTSEKRLRKIMQNIIDHGGNLVLNAPEEVAA